MAVGAVCSQGKVLKQLAPGSRIVRVPQPLLCTHKRLYYRVAIPNQFGVHRPNCHQNCVVNEFVSIHNRVCGEVPLPTPEGLRRLAKTVDALARQVGIVESRPLDDLPLHYSGAKRTKYLQAVDDLRMYPLVPRDAHIKAFIKAEKTDFSIKENPDPRMIQARSMRYNCALAQYLKPIEEKAYWAIKNPFTGLRMIAKGLNQAERATLLRNKLSHFKRPVMVPLDMSRFDQHVSLEILRLEHRFWKSCNRSKSFSRLLRMQEMNVCFTSNGIKYVVRGNRMSGDLNTAGGNCVLMVAMVQSVMKWLGIGKWDLVDDGDDGTVIVEEDQVRRFVDSCPTLFLAFGHEVKVETLARELPDLEWCQCKPIEIEPGKWRFIRKPFKVVSNTLTGVKHWSQSEQHRRAYCNTLGMCELIINLGVPILQEYALSLIRNAATEKVVGYDENDSSFYHVQPELRRLGLKIIQRVAPKPITPEARSSFAQAFGVPVELQLSYEQELREWTFGFSDIETFGLEWQQVGPNWESAFVPAYELAPGHGGCPSQGSSAHPA